MRVNTINYKFVPELSKSATVKTVLTETYCLESDHGLMGKARISDKYKSYLWRSVVRLRILTALAVFLGFGFLGCTRSVSTKTMKLNFNSESGAGAQSGAKMTFAVVNVHLPNGPLVREFEFKDNPIPAGQGFSLEVPNVPAGSFLVQFLGIYEEDGKASRFSYGDATANITSGVPSAEVEITSASIGTFAREGHVSGRYVTDLSGTVPSGPSGDLVMQFQPPGSKPKMNIHPFPMVQGWFNLMVLDGAKMDYVLLPSNQVLFKGVTMNASGDLVIDEAVQTLSNQLMKYSMPATSQKESGNGQLRSRPPTDRWVGFFKPAGSTISLINNRVCYANTVKEAVPGMYRTITAGVLSNPLEIDTSAGNSNVNDLRVIGGGVGDSQSKIYVGGSTACTSPTDNIFVQHTMLATDDDRAGGISAPFMAVRPFARYDQFIAAKYVASKINLSWQFVPGLHPSAMTGVVILAKYSNNGGGGGGDRKCGDLIKDGFMEAGATNSLSTTEFDFNGVGGQSLSTANRYNWQFALCAYQQTAAGRNYLGRPLEGGRLGDSDGAFHSGWADATKTLAPGSSTDYVSLGGSSSRVTGVSVNSKYTALTHSGSLLSAPGDEVMLTVIGNSGNCGTHNGEPINVGQTAFARVLKNTAGVLSIPVGTFLDSMETGTDIAEVNFANSFCYVQASHVLQFRDLDLTSAPVFGYSGTVTPFAYSGSAGQLALRVNGTLKLGASFTVSGRGFQGGRSGADKSGASPNGPGKNDGVSNGSGGIGFTTGNGDGGANIGSGGQGNGAVTPGMGAMNMGGGLAPISMGSGGGTGTSSYWGGDGGGAILIMARETNLSANSVISADGAVGMGTTYGGGGGAGGSVQFYSGSVTTTSGSAINLSFQANGGSGGNATAGAGGGGYVGAFACSKDALVNISAQANPGSSGSLPPANSGMGSATIFDPSQQQYLCELLQ